MKRILSLNRLRTNQMVLEKTTGNYWNKYSKPRSNHCKVFYSYNEVLDEFNENSYQKEKDASSNLEDN